MVNSATTINSNLVSHPYNINTITDVAVNEPVLKITADGYLQLGEDFKMSVSELITCLKAARNLALKDYPEEFV